MRNVNVLREMPSSRKCILTFGLILALLACLWPPWEVYWIGYTAPSHSDPTVLVQLEHGFLFACPKEHEILKCFIDWGRLSTELLVIGFLAGIGIVLTKGEYNVRN